MNKDILISMMEHRCNLLLQKSAAVLQEKMMTEDGSKPDTLLAWNDSQVFYVHNLAKAFANYINVMAYKLYLEEAKFEETNDTRRSLEVLFYIMNFNYILEDGASFLLHGYISAEQFEWIQQSQLEMYLEFKKYALNAVNALLPRDDYFDSMIAPADGDLYGSIVRKLQDTDINMPNLEFVEPIIP